MRTRHAREIRKGLIAARNEVRGRRESDLEAVIRGVVARNHLRGPGMRAYNRTWRRTWGRFE